MTEGALADICNCAEDEIYLANQGVSAAVVDRLASHLEHMPRVTSIDISGNALDGEFIPVSRRAPFKCDWRALPQSQQKSLGY